MKSFLVLVENHGWMLSTLRSAQLLGERFGAHLSGVVIDPGHQVIVAGETAYVEVTPSAVRHRRYEQAHRLFNTFRDGYIATSRLGNNAPVSFGWAENDFVEDRHIGCYSRGFDLVVLSKPQPNGPRWSTFQNVLLNGGKPILVCAATPQEHIGNNIIVYNDGSIEASRAIALSMPILEKAERVTILSEPACEQSASAIIHALRRNGVLASLSMREFSRQSTGQTILTTAAALRCDLIVEGGYTHARLTDCLFGQTTRCTISNADVSILIAH